MNFLVLCALRSRQAWVWKWWTVCLHIMLFLWKTSAYRSVGVWQSAPRHRCELWKNDGKLLLCRSIKNSCCNKGALLHMEQSWGEEEELKEKRDKKTETLQCFGGKRTRFFACSKKKLGGWYCRWHWASMLGRHGEHSIHCLLLMHVSRLPWHETQGTQGFCLNHSN